MTITGNINSTGGVKGTLNAVGGTITGTINNLNLLQCNGGNGKTLNLQSDAIINTLVFANAAASGTVNASGKLTLGGLTFNNNNAAGGTLIIGATSTINGSILNGIKGTIQLNANLTINDPSAGSVNEIDIADGTTYTIDAKNGDVDLLNNGAKINFLGKNSELDLVNTGNADHKFTLFANLIPSTTQDIYGIVRVSSTTNGLTIANNGAFTIGQDPTHRLKEFIVDGSGNIIINPAIFTSLLTVNNTNQVTFNQPLNLGTNGQVIYKANGTLVVNGVTGAIITNAPNQGTLTINSGNVAGAIGDATNSLLAVNIGTNPVTFSSNVFAPVKFTADNVNATIAGSGNQIITSIDFAGKNSTLTISDGINLSGSIDNTGTAGNGILNVGNSVTITKDIGGTNSLSLVSINGSGNINFGGIVNATNINLANANANVVVAGLITGTLNYNANATLFAQGGISGGVNFNANGGNFSVYSNAGQTLTANFDNLDVGENGSVTISHNGDNAGTAATINGTVGGTNPIANFNIINGNEFSTNIVLNGAINATNILFKRDVDQNPNFTIAINNNITGAIQNVSNGTNNFVLNIADGKKITGTIDSQNVLSTIINLAGNNEITGAITNATTINFNGANIKLDSTVNSTNFVVVNDGTSAIITGLMTGDLGYNARNSSVTATGGLTGNVNYNDNNGTFTLGAGSKLTGTVTNGNNATVIALGNGSITGAITGLNTLEFSGGTGTTLNLSDTVNTSINSNITNINYTNSTNPSGTINVNTGLTAGTVTFNASNANGGTIIINAPSTIGLVANAANGTIIVNADFTIQDPNAGNIDEIRIKDKTTYTIDAVSGNIDLLANNRQIIFEGVDSQLALVNSSNTDARTFTLNNNLNPSSTQDGYGIVRVSTAGQDLTITNNGGPFTIGQDNDHRLKGVNHNFCVNC